MEANKNKAFCRNTTTHRRNGNGAHPPLSEGENIYRLVNGRFGRIPAKTEAPDRSLSEDTPNWRRMIFKKQTGG